jgi:hypothetical protein
MPIYQWDEYRGSAIEITDACPLDQAWDPETADRMNDEFADTIDWSMVEVVDFPNGIRLVHEMDERASSCFILVMPDTPTKQDEAAHLLRSMIDRMWSRIADEDGNDELADQATHEYYQAVNTLCGS